MPISLLRRTTGDHEMTTSLLLRAALILLTMACTPSAANPQSWYDRTRPRLDIRPCLKSLITALSDIDARVRALAAQAIGAIGPDASPAVPALITLLSSTDEGSRNTALIGLRRIGPAARDALPAIRHALNDPSADVRRFA